MIKDCVCYALGDFVLKAAESQEIHTHVTTDVQIGVDTGKRDSDVIN